MEHPSYGFSRTSDTSAGQSWQTAPWIAEVCPHCGKAPEYHCVNTFTDALKSAIDRPDFWSTGRVPASRPDEV